MNTWSTKEDVVGKGANVNYLEQNILFKKVNPNREDDQPNGTSFYLIIGFDSDLSSHVYDLFRRIQHL